MAPVCKFWQKGYCKNGDQCRFDHPRGGGGGQPASNNRYAVLNSDSPGHGGGRGVVRNDITLSETTLLVIQDPSFLQGTNIMLTTLGSSSIRHEHPYHLDRELIKTDLSGEKPIWTLSAYGPGRGAPLQLFGGYPREQSFEELRLRYYELASSGNQQQAVQEEQQLVANAEQQIQSALNDINGAIKYIVSGENEHPNRIDICAGRGAPLNQAQAASTNQAAPNAFGQPPSFGQPSAPAQPTSAFGQPSAFGKPATSFGQPPQLGKPANPFSTSTPSFGQPAPFGAPSTPAFGQRAPLGVPPTSAFGQPASLGAQPTPAFGQPTVFGQPASSAPAFGQASNPTSFGQPSNLFAKAQAPAFGQPTPSTGFANQPVPAFGGGLGGGGGGSGGFNNSPTPAPTNLFGRPAPPSQPTSFGPTPTNAPSPFSQPAPSAFHPAAASSLSSTTPSAAGPTRKDASGRLLTWHGRPISYVDDEPCFRRADGAWEKVWFPDGTPSWSRAIDVPEGWWTEEVAAQYRYAQERGEWMGGRVPDVMPKREWVSWDF
ncbi:hypothetical protein MMC34_000688 [Xylographa carneopallida]|nr:hypothetical protein [Xylographa carneopallida]